MRCTVVGRLDGTGRPLAVDSIALSVTCRDAPPHSLVLYAIAQVQEDFTFGVSLELARMRAAEKVVFIVLACRARGLCVQHFVCSHHLLLKAFPAFGQRSNAGVPASCCIWHLVNGPV